MFPFRPGIQKSALFPVCSHAMTQSRIPLGVEARYENHYHIWQ